MSAHISILRDSITPALVRLKVTTRKSWREILRQWSRTLCVDLAYQTQPFGKSGEAQDMGQSAIRNDLLGKKHSGGIIQIWQNYMPTKPGSGGTTKLFVTKDGRVYGVENNLIDLQGKELAAHHKKYRSKSTGRVSRAGSTTRDVGRWRFIDKLVVKYDAFARYFKKVAKLVGFAKGGWAMCAKALGGTRGIPGWVSRQKSAGRVIDMSASETNPSIEMINDVRYVSRCLSQRQVNRALEYHAEKMNTHCDHIVAYEAKKAGFAVR